MLPEPLGYDWGVCINPRSPRSSLLTFEHEGCGLSESGPKDESDDRSLLSYCLQAISL